MYNKFFGSKLNSVLLLVLIILMIIAIHIMLQNKEVYFSEFQKQVPAVTVDQSQTPIPIYNILGNKDDLISFSIAPGEKVSGKMTATGVIKNGYFFEGNVPIYILDIIKKIQKTSHGTATTDWATDGPVTFTTNLDFTGLAPGPGWIDIYNDNPSGIQANNKSILIPITIQ